MMKGLLFFLLLFANGSQAQLQYKMEYKDTVSGRILVQIKFKRDEGAGFTFCMPRSVPGAYSILPYDKYIVNVQAMDDSGHYFKMEKHPDNAPKWIAGKGKFYTGMRYEVDVGSMQKYLSPDASVVLPGYAGILNYSVFGWIEGMEREMITCKFSTFPGWPVFSTIDPREFPEQGLYTVNCTNYYQLADGQTIMGPAFQVKKFNGPVPLYVCSHADQGKEYLEDIGWWGVQSMKILNDYFGDIPFQHFTIVRQHLHLLDSTSVTLAMEHMNSATFTGKSTGLLTGPVDSATRFQRMFGILHHMGHAYIPLRCYGDDYRPYVLPIVPVIRNIWFNEGFIWFICLDTLKSPALKKRLEDNAFHEDAEIAALPLFKLSEVASTQYGSDFRIGQAAFSRGAMMAREMDEWIRKESGGRKSMKDVFHYLYSWGKKNQRPFTMDEFPGLINAGASVDCSSIYVKWTR